ncbi:MAG: hypothetical protein ACYDAD_05300 [Acidimicrobiales bacterium]
MEIRPRAGAEPAHGAAEGEFVRPSAQVLDVAAVRGTRSRGRPRPTWLILFALAFVVALLPLFRSEPRASASAPDRSVHLGVADYDGRVVGTLEPYAHLRASVTRDGKLKSSITGTAGVDGGYSVSLGYDSEHHWGIHNGDVVQVVDEATTRVYTQTVQVAAMLDEDSGRLVGRARPGAEIGIDLYTGGTETQKVGSTAVRAGPEGSFAVDLAAVFDHHPESVGGRPAWRGYVVDVVSTDVPGQVVWRPIQTPNTTLVSTRDLAGGGDLWPGDRVSFELWRGSPAGRVATVSAAVDGDGIPQATIPVHVQAGDVLVTRYHDSAGVERSQTLDPYELTAEADVGAGAVSGRTEPGAPVVVSYYGPGGQEQVVHAQGGADHRYRALVPNMTGDRLVSVFRVADPGFTGVGVQQVEIRTPVVHLDDLAGSVTGYGAVGVDATVTVLRGGRALAAIPTRTGRDGSFSVRVPQEIGPGDQISVVTGSQTLPLYSTGTGALTGSGSRTGANWSYGGTATPGRQVEVSVGPASSCAARTTVGPSGNWSVALPCSPSGTEWVLTTETVVDSRDPAAGSYRQHWQNLAAPTVELGALPAQVSPGDVVELAVTARDSSSGAPPSSVWYQVDDRWLQASSPTFSLGVTLSRGPHTVIAYAFDRQGRHDPAGKPIYGQTPPHQVTVG